MSLLEDRLLRIIELKKQGFDSGAIGKEIGISREIVDDYENSSKRTLASLVNSGYNDINYISEKSGLSSIATKIALEFYDIRYDTKKTRAYMPKDERHKQIRELADKGKNRTEIAAELGISLVTVYAYGKDAGIEFPRKKRGKKEGRKGENIEKIRELTGQGKNVREIAEIIKLAESTVRGYASDSGIKFSICRKSKFDNEEAIAERVRSLLDSGVKSLEGLCKNGRIGKDSLAKLVKKYSLELPNNIEPWRTRPEIDELIDQGLSQTEIGERNHLTSERIRQYIKTSGQYKLWRNKKLGIDKEEFRRLESLEEILLVIEKRAGQLAKKEGWEYEKALEYINNVCRVYKNS